MENALVGNPDQLKDGLRKDSIDFLVNHVILPPKLPQQRESEDEETRGEQKLLQFVETTITNFSRNFQDQAKKKAWHAARSAVQNWSKSLQDGVLREESLAERISGLKESEPFMIHVKAANSGLLIRRTGDDQVVFDAFEASPKAGDVIHTEGRLIHAFPGRSVSVPWSTFADKRLCQELASMIHRLHKERVPLMTACGRNDGDTSDDERECHPGLVTELLLSIVAVFGDNFDSPKIQKHLRDEVNWDGSKLPWRRSPLWLVTRVSLNLVLQATLGHSLARINYKSFMVFLIARISDAAKDSVDSDIKAIINTKLSRRLMKLGGDSFRSAIARAEDAVSHNRNFLESRWLEFQHKEKKKGLIKKAPHVATEDDTNLLLSKSQVYLAEAIKNNSFQARTTEAPISEPVSLGFTQDGLPFLNEVLDPQQQAIVLEDFEEWVFEKLFSWKQGQKSCERGCESVGAILRSYVALSRPLYSDNPRANSIMVLTILEIWRVLDTMCLEVYPMLKEYSPEIDPHALEPLLLPRLSHMKILQKIEQYLEERHKGISTHSRILQESKDDSFSVRFYDASPQHQKLKAKIERLARSRRNEKTREWKNKKKQHEQLCTDARKLIHEHVKWNKTACRGCEPCTLERQAKEITISVDEWPLPKALSQLKAAVFELDCPRGFSAWRDATWLILQDLGRGDLVSCKPVRAELFNYENLKEHAVSKGQRIVFGSTARSCLSSQPHGFPIDLAEVLHDNELDYRLMDSLKKGWVADQARAPGFQPLCVSTLPAGPYQDSGLQHFVDKSSFAPNDVIARQTKCVSGISHHEFLAFASLRAGERTQWLNILRELGSADMTFGAESVHILIRQTALQAGSSNRTTLRAAHRFFADDAFCGQLLSILDGHAKAIQANWKEHHRLSTLIILVLRTLSLTEDSAIEDRAIELLRRLRGVGLSWCRQMAIQLPSCSTEGSAKQLREAILRSALACHTTFDADSDKISKALETKEDVSNIVEASIHMHSNRPTNMEDLPSEVQHSFLLSQKLSRKLFGHLRVLLAKHSAGINQAVGEISDLKNLDGKWAVDFSSESPWISSGTFDRTEGPGQKLKFNLLTGELLVDGQPMGRLPSEITERPLYQRVFSSIHLGLHDGELLIKAKIGTQILRIIPHEHFDGDLPRHFQHDFVHWMDMESHIIEFRPVQRPWAKPSKTLELKFNPDGRSSMQVGNNDLIELQTSPGKSSKLAKSLNAAFNALEKPMHLVATSSRSSGRVEIELPRFGLKFFVNEQGLLESQQLSSTVAEEQDIGCLYGLRNKLVLQGSTRKSVLIPLGSVTVSKFDEHKRVRINCGDGEKIRFVHFYQNEILGTLQGASSVTELLYQAYLHAVTSFPQPDPLTGHNGTSEALTILEDKRLKTPFTLTKDDIRLLAQIAELTPRRELHSTRLRHAQRVLWRLDVDQLTQHEAFYTLARDIMSHNSQFAMLSNDEFLSEEVSRGDQRLLHRAHLRNSSARVPCLTRRLVESGSDKPSDSRDGKMESPRSIRAFKIAALIHDWKSRIKVMRDLPEKAQSWKFVKGYGQNLEQEMEMTIDSLLDFQIERHWGYLYSLCRDSGKETHRYKLLFLFTTMAFGNPASKPYLRTLLAIAVSGQFKDVLPDHSFYELDFGHSPVSKKLEADIRTGYKAFDERPDESPFEREVRHSAYLKHRKQQCGEVARHLEQQWPCEIVSLPDAAEAPLIDLEKVGPKCKLLFSRWFQNHHFFNHLRTVGQLLLQFKGTKSACRGPRKLPAYKAPAEKQPQEIYPSILSLLGSRNPPALRKAPEPFMASRSTRHMEVSSNHDELRRVLENLQIGGSHTRVTYINDLLSSLDALEKAGSRTLPQEISDSLDVLISHREMLLEFFRQSLAEVSQTLQPEPAIVGAKLASMTGLWPRTTPYSLLACLSVKNLDSLSESWKAALTALGEAICLLQRSERLIELKTKNNALAFYNEAEEAGRQGWSSLENPSWLLMEIQGNFQIRRIQATVAKKVIDPDGKENAMVQLNMGEGKSSVITPMVLVALADRKQIARLLVLKPLLKQTNSLLSQRLGGLVNRSVYHLPFTRDTRIDECRLPNLRKIYDEVLEQQGVILALPEHILSFRLLGREMFMKQPKLARSVMGLDLWLQQTCRDVLDESDELLDSRSMLVYSIGNQQHLDDQSQRWNTILEVFTVLAGHVKENSARIPTLEVDYRGRSFPFLTFLDDQTCARVLETLVTDILRRNLCGICSDRWSSATFSGVQNFISRRRLAPFDFNNMEEEFGSKPVWNKLHLLRGLFAHGILDFALRDKLWLVNYGLAPDRCQIAVPYRAKGLPSANANFSHPDVAIVLTCLSYYWGGLTQNQLKHAFEILMAETDPYCEYERWTMDAPELPPELETLDGVNLDDVEIWECKIYPSLRFSKAVIDFYMSRVVFPHEAKEFPRKLSLSAWDLASTNRSMPTTGFSGTVDTMIPSLVKQRDLPELQDTNAMVMELLLKEENRGYIEAKNAQGRRLGLEELLQKISNHSNQEKKIQVLIDVGAQVLEAENEDVAKLWLTFSPDYEAAVFFNENDEIMVVDRDSHIEPLSISPFNKKLDSALIYLDEVHTRGIDLDLPLESCAVVTLGPKTTKDRLVQACMRMRKLGCNQSLVFLAQPEVHRAIFAVSEKTDEAELDSTDVLKWALSQTCSTKDGIRPLYVAQGLEYCHRSRICSKFLHDMGAMPSDDDMPSEEAILCFNKEISEPDARQLKEMYGAEANKNTVRPCLLDESAQKDPLAQPLVREWRALQNQARKDPTFEDEQEREISHEVEQLRDIQKAPAAAAHIHELHDDVINFVKTGTWDRLEGCPFYPAFEALRNTTAHKKLPKNSNCCGVFVTRDFIKTVHQGEEPDQDQFIRPVKWVVSSTKTSDLVVISPFEANEMLLEFQKSTAVRLHTYSAMTSRSMKSFSDLSSFTITGIKPGALTAGEQASRQMAIAQLDIFAGCLFLKDFDSYLVACDFLGLNIRKNRHPTNSRKRQKISKTKAVRIDGIGQDGFTEPNVRKEMDPNWESPFESSPLPFLRALIGIRRKGQAYAQTHMGSVLNARPLTKESFQEDLDDTDDSDA
ncbi:uncharacterized protein J3D65DRAFT_583432 [Phyllosticta citribraziliensis]|uniref:ubiquitinyl hydrolase 1 n=1 Tax=Phyllosticta citribraziliensis TaxID=989973 RepID=A0ABR1M7B8_9PEZI